MDVWVGGTEGDSFPPIRTSFCAYSIYKLLDAAGYPATPAGLEPPDAGQTSWSKPIPRDLVRVANLRPPVATDSEDDEPGFLAKMFGKKKPVDVEQDSADVPSSDAGKEGMTSDSKKCSDSTTAPSVDKAPPRPSLLSRFASSRKNVLDADKMMKEETAGEGDEGTEREVIEPGAGVMMDRKGSVMTMEGSVAERRTSIMEAVSYREAEKEQKLEAARAKQQLAEDEYNNALISKPTKTVKSKPQKVNADFERELLAATIYRDPFFERMQMAKNAKAVRQYNCLNRLNLT